MRSYSMREGLNVIGVLLVGVGMIGIIGVVGGMELNTLTLSKGIYSSIGFMFCVYLGIFVINKSKVNDGR